MSRQHRRSSHGAVDFSDPHLIAEIAGWLEQAGVSAIEIEQAERTVRIVVDSTGATVQSRPAAASPPKTVETQIDQHGLPVKTPIAGEYIDTHPSRKIAQSAIGAAVEAGQIVGFIKIGPMLVAVDAPASGILSASRGDGGALVGFGETVFTIESQP
jgi:acetyl-CoA carboxylase biotin carboxyl carrier protein